MNISPSSIAINIASFKSQALGAMLGSAFGSDASANPLLASNGSATDFISLLTGSSSVTGQSATGRNTALPDPESAYQMMSLINSEDVTYKAQFSELSQMQSAVAQVGDAGQTLGGITAATADDAISAQLQGFVGQYNDWIQQFNPDMQSGGLLAATQAAQVARFELSQSVANILNGAKDGVHGLADLGITIDPKTQLASLDSAKLSALLASNKQGAVDSIQEFSANFAAAANLLDSTGNFIPNQLDNLNRVIQYISKNEVSLAAEFGTGDPATPTGRVAQALAAYNRVYGGG